MTPYLSRRLGRALNQHQATLNERAVVVEAAQKAETWDDLPAAMQALVVDIEGRPGPMSGLAGTGNG